jgi:uncharacterized protein
MVTVIPGAVIVIAKTPEPGVAKTRLSPPLSADEACDVAWACLHDTLAAAGAVPAQRHVLLLAGAPGDWIPDPFEVIGQRGDGLEERLANGLVDVGGNAVVIAMDTPQVNPNALADALQSLSEGYDSVIGPAADGGYWLIGIGAHVHPFPVFDRIPMSTVHTGQDQAARLRNLGLRTLRVESLTDIDTIADLVQVASSPHLGAHLSALLPALNLVGRHRSPASRGGIALHASTDLKNRC